MSESNNILITADSTCDLPYELVQKYNITIIPLSISLGDKSYLDGVDVKPNDIYSYAQENADLPKTSAVPPGRYADVFKKAVDEGRSVVHIGLSSAISSSYQNACLAASELDDVYCVDSKSLCTAMGLLVLKACDFKEQGFSAKRIALMLENTVPKLSATFVLNSLEYLHKGGRCSSVARFGANVLGIKPSIAVDNQTGKMDVAKKYRGKIDIVYKQYAKDCLSDLSEVDTSRVVIANSGGIDSSILDGIYNMVEQTGVFKEIILADAGCTISSHCGPKTLAIFYIKG